jgi:hypothetical protein
VLALVPFWVLMTNHCGLEAIPGLGFLACSSETEPAPHRASDCGDDAGVCATVESGLYKSEESQVSIAGALFAPAEPPLVLHAGTPPPASRLECGRSSDPERLANIWQFSLRAALLPRAPSLVS